jgi:hypothetical protein
MSLKDQIGVKLRCVVQECCIRGLLQSANWASEQLLGLESPEAPVTEVNSIGSSIYSSVLASDSDIVQSSEVPVILFSSTLLSIGQYHRSAHNLNSFIKSAKVSNLLLFIFVYSKYLAGEKVLNHHTDEKVKRNESRTRSKSKRVELGFVDVDETTKNPFVAELYRELFQRYKEGTLDSYVLYIFAIICRDYYDQYGANFSELFDSHSPQNEASVSVLPQQLFIESLALSPWNWSCWLDLAKFCLEHNLKVPTWEEICARYSRTGKIMENIDKHGGRVMYAFFLSHVYLEKHRGDLSLQVRIHRFASLMCFSFSFLLW